MIMVPLYSKLIIAGDAISRMSPKGKCRRRMFLITFPNNFLAAYIHYLKNLDKTFTGLTFIYLFDVYVYLFVVDQT